MPSRQPDGVDADGFIPAAPSQPLPAPFQPLLDDLCRTLTAEAGALLDGIYLYGSVARGSAKPGVSDLDVTLVLHQPPNAATLASLEALRLALAARHPEVVKIDFDIGSRQQVLDPQHRYSWGYWLKHHCRCLWGTDLAAHFAPFKPSRAIALALNGDFYPVLSRYADQIDQPAQPSEVRRLQREASRKLIRATNILRSDQDPGWPLTLEEHVAQFVQCYPAQQAQIEFFLRHSQQPTASAEEFTARLRDFCQWCRQVSGQ
ncbi:nucleotidyltransferase domain-containing protein [Pseudomonas sp. CF161]|uniref:nucleotidyltransferase domain-containing protein n=1 Tax=Pseudomonas sp. CF161 TaxID=911241 RepID=UPI00035510D2|nr:nucleotidyltransferase domain-containing protein [Pseudomonas sp. CF161]EPL14442.1 hypothetical protein CF161_08316 [Pseudomonas sp. CF161]